jgi:hypothetical protein
LVQAKIRVSESAIAAARDEYKYDESWNGLPGSFSQINRGASSSNAHWRVRSNLEIKLEFVGVTFADNSAYKTEPDYRTH